MEAVFVFGGIIVALSAFVTAAIDYSIVPRRIIGFIVALTALPFAAAALRCQG